MSTDTDGGTIPGLTRQGEAVLRLIVREEVAKGNGQSEIKRDIAVLKERVGGLVWWNRATIVASMTTVGALIISLVR